MNKKMKAIQKSMQDKFAQARKAQDEGRRGRGQADGRV